MSRCRSTISSTCSWAVEVGSSAVSRFQMAARKLAASSMAATSGPETSREPSGGPFSAGGVDCGVACGEAMLHLCRLTTFLHILKVGDKASAGTDVVVGGACRGDRQRGRDRSPRAGRTTGRPAGQAGPGAARAAGRAPAPAALSPAEPDGAMWGVAEGVTDGGAEAGAVAVPEAGTL